MGRKIVLVVGGLIAAFVLFVNLVNAPHKRETDQHNRENGDRIVQALRAYHNDHGSYPEKLDDLSPKYMNPVPYAIGYPGDTTPRSFHYTLAEGGRSFTIGYWEAPYGILPSDDEAVFESSNGEWKTELR